MKKISLLLLAVLFLSCSTSKIFIDDDFPQIQEENETSPGLDLLKHQVFLLGDAGEEDAQFLAVMESLRQVDALSDVSSTLVFLGDDVYPAGLPDSSSEAYPRAKAIVDRYFSEIVDYEGKVVFIPGNHDWQGGFKGDESGVVRLANYINSKNDSRVSFLPEDGLPGPHEIKIEKGIRLVAVDSEWWVNREGKPFEGASWTEDAEEFVADMEDIIRRNRKRDLLVVGHHPLRTNGFHGGHMPLNMHIFPLTDIHPALKIPLPIIGSLYPLYLRSVGGGPQDVANKYYQQYTDMLYGLFDRTDDIVYAAGHAHSLQYFRSGSTRHFTHEIVSGSASKLRHVAPGNDAAFTASVNGFALLNYYLDGSIWMEMHSIDSSEPLFQIKLKNENLEDLDEIAGAEESEFQRPDFPTSVKMAIEPSADWGNALSYLFVGEHYRKAWATEIEIPVLDLAREKGGLEPVKLGGSAQTNSLRVKDDQGQEYVLRSIKKDATRTAVRFLKSEIANKVISDQATVLNPFGAFLIPKLADAAGVYHTNPQIKFVPDDPLLGIYREIMANQVVLFEERPDDDMSHLASMGNAEKVISSRDLWKKIDDDIDHRVDSRHFLKSRLFDVFIGDWDRHADQWRWGAFEPDDKQGKIYRAIPRDRDFAFMKMDGFIPWILKNLTLRQYQNFDDEYGYLKGLTNNSNPQVRRFTAELTGQDWESIARELQESLSDEDIEKAMDGWPKEVSELHREEFVGKLKARRDKISVMAKDFYNLQSGVVDVVGSNKHEEFIVTRGPNSTRVVINKVTKEGVFRKEIFNREFDPDETREVRIYGLSGRDAFTISGSSNQGPLIRMIGGRGEDSFDIDDGNKVNIYDSIKTTTVLRDGGAKVYLDDDPANNEYSIFGFSYSNSVPNFPIEFNSTDGFFFGAGTTITKGGFRKRPHASIQSFSANFAPSTLAFNLYYSGKWIDVFGDWGTQIATRYQSPTNVRNYYGLGNETVNDQSDSEFYQANIKGFEFTPGLSRRLGTSFEFSIDAPIRFVEVSEDSDLFTLVNPDISDETFEDQVYAGTSLTLELNTRDNSLNPRSGLLWSNSTSFNVGLLSSSETYQNISTSFSTYFTPSYNPQITFAYRIGFDHLIGDFPFFDSSTLGSKSNLRGFRSTRFAGRSAAYSNLDLRMSLFDYSNFFLEGRVGVLGFFDAGRVWTDGEDSNLWHRAIGFGPWINILNTSILSATWGKSKDETSLNLKLGFFF